VKRLLETLAELVAGVLCLVVVALVAVSGRHSSTLHAKVTGVML
jgi:hypothetical protein